MCPWLEALKNSTSVVGPQMVLYPPSSEHLQHTQVPNDALSIQQAAGTPVSTQEGGANKHTFRPSHSLPVLQQQPAEPAHRLHVSLSADDVTVGSEQQPARIPLNLPRRPATSTRQLNRRQLRRLDR
jgi:hypothetical protein